MNVLFANNASALLAATIDSLDTTIQVASGFGANFPSPTGSQYFMVTLENDSGDIEIVKCTSRSGDLLTVQRGQDGTTAQAFTLNVTRVELRLCAEVMEEMLQLNGGTMTGELDMNGNNVRDAVLVGSSTSIQEGEVAGVPIRGATGVTGNQILVPSNGIDRPTIGGVDILIDGDLSPYALDADVVHDTGAETIAGVKTFSNSPIFSDEIHAQLSNSPATPAYSFNGDTDTGMYRSAANTLAWACGGSERMTLSSAGALTCDSDITAFSDRRKKMDIQPIGDALKKVLKLNGYTFERTDAPGRRHSGVIAQEVEQVLPEVIHFDDEGYRSVAYGNMVGLLIEAIKELYHATSE